MVRVIRDSDDESDDELIPEEHQAGEDASPKHSNGDTSSTEALRRQIEAAHRAHLQSQLFVHDGQMPAPDRSSQTQACITTGTETDMISNEIFQTSFPTERTTLPHVLGSLPSSQQQSHGLVGHIHQSAETTTGAEWVLDGTIREAYAQHDPNVMFPEPSSTIPNATFTQQRMMEGLHAPALLGSDIDTGGTVFEPLASIPWSEYMKSPTATVEQPVSSAREPHISQTASSTTVQHSKCKVTESTQQSYTKDNCSSPRSTSDDDLADLSMSKEQYRPRPSRSRSMKVNTAEAIDYSIRPEKAIKARKRVKSAPTTASPPDSLSTPNKVRQICEMGFTPSTSAQALQKNNGDVTQTVDWLITNRVADDELVPQTSQMSEAIRNRLTATIETPMLQEESQKSGLGVEQMAAIDIDAPPNVTGARITTARTETATHVVDLRSPSKVQVVIPAKSPIAIGEQAQTSVKRRKTVSDQPKPASAVDAVKSAKTETKRGRGRPRKAVKDSTSPALVQQGEDECPQKRNEDYKSSSAENAQPAAVQAQEGMKTANTNSIYPGQGPQSLGSQGTTSVKRSTPEPGVLPDRPEIEPITPERVKKAAPREQPLSNRAKITYRVGLSKRARIAPLLRTMKK